MTNRRVTFGRILVYLTVATALFVAGLEVALRITSWLTGNPMALTLEDDPVLHHRWIPSLNIIDRNRSIAYRHITNQQSWIGKEDVATPKPADTLRVVFLGDSNTQGVVGSEDKMVEIVGKRLNEMGSKLGMKVETINTGTSSYSFLQYYLVAKGMMAYAPDLVVINVDMTDVADDAAYRLRAKVDGKGEIIGIDPESGGTLITGVEGARRMAAGIWRVLSRWSYLARTVGLKIYAYQIQQSRGAGGSLPRAGSWLAPEWSPETEAEVAFSMDILARTLSFLRDKGVACYVTSVPHYPQFTGAWSSRPHQLVADTVRKNGGLYMDLFTTLKESGMGSELDASYWKEDPTHFNRAGNKAFAAAHLNFLLDPANRLLPSGFYEESQTSQPK